MTPGRRLTHAGNCFVKFFVYSQPYQFKGEVIMDSTQVNLLLLTIWLGLVAMLILDKIFEREQE